MINVGLFNTLKVISHEDFGVYLDAQNLGKALFKPEKEFPEIGDQLKVFLYFDKNNSLTATQITPKIELGKVAILNVVDINEIGAFVDWGLPKNLLVPYAQQTKKLIRGLSYAIYCYQDKYNDKLLGSTKLSKHLQETSNEFTAKQKVNLLICGKTSLGYKAVINDTHLGLIHNDDAYRTMKVGDQVEAYIKNIREDGKINLSVHIASGEQIGDLADQVLADLQINTISYLTDKSSPKDIYQRWNVSKGSYKKALGNLYKKKLITLSADKVELNKPK